MRAVYIAITSLLVACAAAPPVWDKVQQNEITPGSSSFGNYLAARHAQAIGRTDFAGVFYKSLLEFEPENLNFRRNAFVTLLMEGRYKESLTLATEMHNDKESGQLVDSMVIVGDIKDKKYASCLLRTKKTEKKGINTVIIPLVEAWCLAGQGKIDAAIKAIDPLDKQDGFKALHDLHGAMINELGGRVTEAERLFLKVLNEKTQYSLFLHELVGQFYERQGALNKARALYVSYRKHNPRTQAFLHAINRLDAGTPLMNGSNTPDKGIANALFDLANSMLQHNVYDMAVVLVRMALFLHPDFPFAQNLLASLLEQNKRLEAANEIYRSINPNSYISWSAGLNIANNLNKMNRTDEAITVLRSVANDDPADPAALITIGDILRGKERFEEAFKAYEEALQRVQKSSNAISSYWFLYYVRGIVLERLNRWDEAEASLLKALDLQPEQPYVLNYLGYSWVERHKHLTQAREMLEKAVQKRPQDGYIVDSLGWVLYQLGDYVSAVKHLEYAVVLRPNDPVINSHLGDAYWRVERKREARFQWRRSLSLNPKPDLIVPIKKKIEKGLKPL